MGLWIKNADGTIERAAGGGGGTFDGDHVLTGDPLDPPADLAAGQLLWDGVEGGSGGGGDAGPHDHDYLPLTGGTLTGDLTVDGQIQASAGSTAYPALAIGNSSTGFCIDESAGGLTTALNGAWKQIVYEDLIRIRKDLHVDGTETRLRDRISMRSSSEDGSRIDYEQKTDQDKKWITSGPHESDDNSFIFEWYDSGWTRTLALWKDRARFYGDLTVDGYFRTLGNARIDGVIHSPGTYANSGGGGANVHVTTSGYFYRTGTRGGAFAPSKLARNSDVLERAETATLPPEIETDDEGNQTNTAEVEAHDTVELFDVVTALLVKVKQLSAEIEELKGA